MKFVYVFSVDELGRYDRQLHLSVLSLKASNEDAHSVLLVDSISMEVLKECADILRFFNEIIVIDAIMENAVARSRFLKTQMREFVSGDFLYLDTDTIVVGKIDEQQFSDMDFGAVEDEHLDEFGQRLKSKSYSLISGLDLPNNYYNSGVLYCRDTECVRFLFRQWHKLWDVSRNNGYLIDQPSLAASIAEFSGKFSALKPEYNVQILHGWKYLKTAIIIHYYGYESKKAPFGGTIRANLSCIQKLNRDAKNRDISQWLLNIRMSLAFDYIQNYEMFSLHGLDRSNFGPSLSAIEFVAKSYKRFVFVYKWCRFAFKRLFKRA